MMRERLAWVLAVLGLVLGAWWLSANTEWVDETSRRPAQGEARDNPVYAAEQLLRRLGMDAAHHESLAALPPEQGRLVLLSGDWVLVPERAEQLHQWVLRGGHLVLTRDSDWEDTPLEAWVPVEVISRKPAGPAKPGRPFPASSAVPTEHTRSELISAPPLWGSTDRVVTCDNIPAETLRPTGDQSPSWALTRLDLTYALRVPVGQGTVTVLNADGSTFHNGPALRCDMPLLLAAAVQAEPGAVAWIYLHERREPLLAWLWQRGWIAVLIGLLALVAALWRAAVRFGPLQAPPPRLRRSISEQVRGLAAYLQRGGREALLEAQRRALDEAAARRLVRYARLPMAERMRALAAATGLPADDLYTAMTARNSTRPELLQRLHWLETARRRLQSNPRPTSP